MFPQLGCFRVWAINNTTVNIHVKCLLQFLLIKYLKVECPDHVVRKYLTLQKLPVIFLKEFVPLYVPTSNILTNICCYLFILLVSFKEHISLMKFKLPICSFMDFSFGFIYKKSLPNPRSQRFIPVFFYVFCSFSS